MDSYVSYASNRLFSNYVSPSDPEGKTVRERVEHCLHQLVRFANLAEKHGKWRAVQFGFNLGRVQEILDVRGGVDYWWRTYEPLCNANDWQGIITLTRNRLTQFKMSQPSDQFINKL
jgi:hypothetical protein